MTVEKRALSVPDAAKAAGVGRTTVFEAIRKGELAAKKIGRRTIVLIDDLDVWLKSLPKIREKEGHGHA